VEINLHVNSSLERLALLLLSLSMLGQLQLPSIATKRSSRHTEPYDLVEGDTGTDCSS
jgi:hypothetical protein